MKWSLEYIPIIRFVKRERGGLVLPTNQRGGNSPRLKWTPS